LARGRPAFVCLSDSRHFVFLSPGENRGEMIGRLRTED
jgi:hypothetical protein